MAGAVCDEECNDDAGCDGDGLEDLGVSSEVWGEISEMYSGAP